MANKAVPGYTQVPVAAKDIVEVRHTRLNAAGTVTDVAVTYNVRDDLDVVRATRTLSFQGATYPTTGAAIIAACNAAEGT